MKHLRYFDALARTGHFGRAAKACAISQPALSVQVKELEEILGAPLVERGCPQVRLTAWARRSPNGCAPSCARSTSWATWRGPRTGRWSGRLRVGVIPTMAPYLLPGRQGAVGTYPGISTSISAKP